MKNGTQSSTYLDSDVELGASEAQSTIGTKPNEKFPVSEPPEVPRGVFAFVAVSLGCAVAAVAAGSYALWLSRQQGPRETLTDVHDILKSCQDRMQKIEADLSRIPTGIPVL